MGDQRGPRSRSTPCALESGKQLDLCPRGLQLHAARGGPVSEWLALAWKLFWPGLSHSL